MKCNKSITILLPGLLTAILVAGCDPTPTSTGSSGSSCPPIASDITEHVSGADVSSVTVPAGATAEEDSGGYWCGSPPLSIAKLNVNNQINNDGCFNNLYDTTPPCTPYNALAAVDVRPSDIAFPSPPKPQLRYDLTQTDNQPVCDTRPEGCSTPYTIYQLVVPRPPAPNPSWQFVSYAYPSTYLSKAVAQGSLNHFSIYALVEIPEPTPVPSPSRAQIIVASDFIEDDVGAIRVAFTVLAGELPEGVEETRLFRFTNVDPNYGGGQGGLPEACLERNSVAEQLTCLFPVGANIRLELGVNGDPNLVSIFSEDNGYEAQLFATVEIH